MTSIPNWFVIVMGLGIVFIGLIAIILLCKILGAVCSLAEAKEKKAPASLPSAPAPAAAPAPVQGNRQEIIVAIGVAIAEEIGVSAEAIRIKSIKRI